MFPASIVKTISQHVDRLTLYAIYRQIPDSLDTSYQSALSLEAVLAKTEVNRQKTAVYSLTAPGEHPVWLNSALGEILCHVKTRPAFAPHAPLLLYHHGFAEMPFTSTWSSMIPKNKPFPVHAVCVQAPYHNRLIDPFKSGFSSVHHIFQMFAGSLRIMELLQAQFESEGAAFTVAGGISWGGITSMLYEGIFKRARATIPMFSSPNLAQLFWELAARYNRAMPVPRATVDGLFDFTAYYEGCDKARVFPVLGKDDCFFPYDEHAAIFPEELVVTLPAAHVGAMWRMNVQIRRRVLEVMKWAANNPR